MTSVDIKNCDLTPVIKAAMGLRGWRQQDLAREIEMTQSAVSDILKRGWAPRDTIQSICAALDISWTATIGNSGG